MKYSFIITMLLALILNSSCNNNQPGETENKVTTAKTETIVNNDLANEGLKGKVKKTTITMYMNVTVNKDSTVSMGENNGSVTNMYGENGFLTGSEIPESNGNKYITKYVKTENGDIDAQTYNNDATIMMHMLIKRDGANTILHETYEPGEVLVSKQIITLNNKYRKEKTETINYAPDGSVRTTDIAHIEYDEYGNKSKSENIITINNKPNSVVTKFITQEKDKYNNPTKVLSFTTSPMGEMAMYITTEYEYYE